MHFRMQMNRGFSVMRTLSSLCYFSIEQWKSYRSKRSKTVYRFFPSFDRSPEPEPAWYGMVWYTVIHNAFQSLICKSVWPPSSSSSEQKLAFQRPQRHGKRSSKYVHMGLSPCACLCASLCKYERPMPITHLKKWNFWHCFILLSVH